MIGDVSHPEIFKYPFLKTNLLQFSQKKSFSTASRKDVLRRVLVGLVALHEKTIIHSDIKPDNILLDYEVEGDSHQIQKVQIADLEDSVILLGKRLLPGIQLWRSPGSWTRARQGTPSDIFSFGIVSIYVMLDDTVLRASDEGLVSNDSWRFVLRRQISYFATDEDFKGLLQWIGEENPFFKRLITLAGTFDHGANLRKPFEYWEFVDKDFRDLIGKMTNLDPMKRITAAEALMHPWFSVD